MELKDQIASVKRELKLREVNYPKWVASGKMKQKDANHEIEAMRSTLHTLLKLVDENVSSANTIDDSPKLYKQFVDVYNQFCKDTIGVGAKMNGAEGKALKQIIKFLTEQSKAKSEDGALNAFKFIFQHWERVGPFIGNQKSLTQINKNLIEILEKIRNGHNKQQAAKNQLSKLEQDIINRRQRGSAN